MSNLVTAEEEQLCKKALVGIFNSKALFYGMTNEEKRILRSTYFINLQPMIQYAKTHDKDPVMHILGIQDVLLDIKKVQVNAHEYK